jgi:hypothetical protein
MGLQRGGMPRLRHRGGTLRLQDRGGTPRLRDRGETPRLHQGTARRRWTPTRWCASTWPRAWSRPSRTPGARATAGSTSGSRLRPAPPGRPRRAPAPLPGRRPRLPGGAVARGLRRGLRDRILRGTGHDGFYSTKKLGAFGADLGAVACFFSEPWRRPAPALSAPARAWLLNEAAFSLRALGRLAEALEPMRAGAEMYVEQEDWKNAAISYGNLSELQLALGRIDDALADARRAVAHADRSGDAFLAHGHAHHARRRPAPAGRHRRGPRRLRRGRGDAGRAAARVSAALLARGLSLLRPAAGRGRAGRLGRAGRGR